jgi:hypothetical protein
VGAAATDLRRHLVDSPKNEPVSPAAPKKDAGTDT